jgi:hypothetical protein
MPSVNIILSDSDKALLDEIKFEVRRINDEKIPDVLLTCSEAARYLGYSSVTISTYIKRGKLTKRTKGKVTGIPLREVMRLKRKNRGDAGELPDS